MSTPDNIAQGTTPTAILDRVDEAVCALDNDWQFTYVNQQAATLFDRNPQALLGESLWEQFPDVADSLAFDELHDAVGSQEPRRFDMPVDSGDVWVTVRAYPSSDGLTVCFHEVTAERERELELQRSRRLFESVFEETNDALVVADTDRRITEFNPAAERLFGCDASAVVGEQSRVLYADAEAFEQQGGERFNEQAAPRSDRYVVEYERADGTTFEGETVGTPLQAPDGETLAFVATIRDVTSRVEYARDIERRNRTLKQFHEITTEESESFEDQVTAVLELATEYLGLDVGMLAETDEQECIPRHAFAPDTAAVATDRRPIEATFCERVHAADGQFGFHDASEAGVADHPAANSWDIAAYIGVQVRVDGEQYGTLNFASTAERAEPFSESENTFVRIVAQWAGKEISRLRSRERANSGRERLRQIIDILPQLVYAKDESGTYLLANDPMADAYGTTVEELEGATDADFVDNEAEAEQFRADDRAVIDSGEPKHIPEEPLTTADGDERLFETRKIPYDPANTDGDAVLGVSTDITERKQRESELEVQSAAIEASMEGIAIFDGDEYIYMNEAHAAVFDYEPDELIGSSWRRLYDDEMVEYIEQAVFPKLEREGQWRGETVGLRRDGTTVHQDLSLSLLDDGRLICTNRDITARKARQNELEQYEALVENMNEVAFIVDPERRLTYANKQALSYAGVTPSAVLGREMGELVAEMGTDEAAQAAFMNALDATLAGEIVDDRYLLELDTSTGEYAMEYVFAPFVSDGERRAAIVARDITEQRTREQELERKRARLRALFDESPDGIIVHDERGEILDVNTTQLGMLGYDYGTLCEMNVAEVEMALGRPELRDLWSEMSVGETTRVEGRHRRENGSIFPAEIWISKTDVQGQTRFIALARDITERKEREHEMVRNREFLEKTQEIASVGGWELDRQTDELQWTDEVYRIHGLAVDTAVTVEDGIDYYHPDDRPTIAEAFDRLVKDGEPYDEELRIVTADDEVRWVRTVGDPQLDDGKVVGIRGIFQDITERKEREQDVRELTERLDLAVEGANLGVWDWDMTTDAVTFNEQWASMLGLTVAELEPTLETWQERIHPADTERVEDSLEAHIAGEAELYDCDHRMRTADGEWKWVRDVGEVVERDADGQPARAVGIHLDISEQKTVEKSLEEERDMFAQGPAVVFKWANEDGWPVEYVSENVADAFGYTATELESGAVPYDALIHDDDLERVTAEVGRQGDSETGRINHDPYRMVTADGDVRWVTDNTKVIRTDGEITHYLGYLVDITERKRLEQSLRASERSVREVTEIASDTDREFDEKLDAILELGRERLDLPYGFLTRVENETQHVVAATGTHQKLQAGVSGPLSESYCQRTIEQDDPLTVQNAVEEAWPNDTAYEAFGFGCYIGGAVEVDGDTYGTLCFADRADRDHQFDDSERAFVELLVQWLDYELASESVETKLRQLNGTAQRLLSAGDSAEVASVAIESAREVLDLQLTGLWWHDEAENALVPAGTTAEATDVIGQQPTFDGGESLAWEAFRHDEIGAYDDLHDVSGRFNEDTELRAELIAPLGDHGVLVSGSTEPQAFSETDRGLVEILAATVETALNRAEREQELRDTRERLEQSNQELEQFAYAASHDLQEPLRTVSSYLTLLERRNRDALDEDAMEFIDFAVDGADRMREMIQALLAYSRVDTQGQAFEPTEMRDVFETVTHNLGATIDESDAAVELPGSPGRVVGDTSQLVQLFQNLVENGIKYSDGKPSVEVSVARRDDDTVEYAVADDGIGIDPGQLDGIFEVFQRLHTREEFEGTGIGLSVCRKIVDRHDGEIRVESSPGEGSTFFVTLPVAGESDE